MQYDFGFRRLILQLAHLAAKLEGSWPEHHSFNDTRKPVKDTDPDIVCKKLLETCLSLQLSTIGTDGFPHSGYTPYVLDPVGKEGGLEFTIFVSELSVHTRDMLQTPKVSIMIIEDEAASKQVFARTRVTYNCDVQQIERDHADYAQVLDRFQARQGNTVSLLRELPDFHLMRLRPFSGQFVMGFGQAFSLSGPSMDVFEHSRRA